MRGNPNVTPEFISGIEAMAKQLDFDEATGKALFGPAKMGLQGSTGHSSGSHVHIEAAPSTIRSWVGDLLDGRFDQR